MSSNVVNQSPYLRSSRNFPLEAQPLAVEVNKSYLDISEKMNLRTIGIFPTSRPALTGESWFLTTNQKQQTLRQAYPFTSVATPIPHGIDFTRINGFTRCFGSFTDGTNWYGLIFGSNVAIAGQISFYLAPTAITFLSGGGAPAVTSGTVVLEWLSQE